MDWETEAKALSYTDTGVTMHAKDGKSKQFQFTGILGQEASNEGNNFIIPRRLNGEFFF